MCCKHNPMDNWFPFTFCHINYNCYHQQQEAKNMGFLHVVWVLIILAGIGAASWFAIPKGKDQTCVFPDQIRYSLTVLGVTIWLAIDSMIIEHRLMQQIDPDKRSLDSVLLLSDVSWSLTVKVPSDGKTDLDRWAITYLCQLHPLIREYITSSVREQLEVTAGGMRTISHTL